MATSTPQMPQPWFQANVTTPFSPTAPYSQDQIQQSTNRMVAGQQRSNSMPALLKQFQPTSGFSMSPATAWRATNALAGSNANVNSIKAMNPLSMNQQNAQSMLGQQTAQEQNALQLAGLYGQQQDMNFNQGMQGLQTGSQLLQMLGFGGF